jgi:ABC-2 type transport system ATP-binding protein
MSAVEVDRLEMRYGDVEAVRGLSFAAGAGEVTCVLGRNGAGKTSTIEALEGLRRPHAGRMSVLGFDPQLHHAALVLRVGVMLQEVGLPPAVRVGELARCTADLYPASLDIDELLDVLDLKKLEHRTIRQLSGGEQRRLALALALVGRPQVVFLDEPTAGVDQDGREVVREIIGGLRDEGVCVVLTTHDLAEAERVADRFVVIDAGQLRAEGTLDELRNRGGGDNEVRFRAPEGLDTLNLANHLGGWQYVQVTEISWGEYRVTAPPTPALIAGITSWLDYYGLPLADLRTGRQTLEELFMQIIGSPDAPAEVVNAPTRPGGPPQANGRPDPNVRRPITGQTPAFGRPPTLTRPHTSGQTPAVGRPPGNGRAHNSGQHPTVGRRPPTGQTPTVGRPPISGQAPALGRRWTTGQHPTVGRPPGNGRDLGNGSPATDEWPLADETADATGEYPGVAFRD